MEGIEGREWQEGVKGIKDRVEGRTEPARGD